MNIPTRPTTRPWRITPSPVAVLISLALLNLFALATPAFASSAPITCPHQAGWRASFTLNEREVALRASGVITRILNFPFVFGPTGCSTIPNESYGTVAPLPPPTDRPAEKHADLNLALRGYVPTTGYRGLIDIGGPVDPYAPQLPGLFSDNRTGIFTSLSRVYDWDWECNCRGPLLTDPEVTLAGLGVSPGEVIRVPRSGYDIGRLLPSGHSVMVLYASADRLTLKYTREDNVVQGYTLHLENVCVEPRLLALYQQSNSAGRALLPGLYAGQGLARARTTEVGVAIRDWGTFLDPRSRKDWWQGR